MIGTRELFEFDLMGFVIIRQFLPTATVAYINSVLDAQPSASDAHKFSFMLVDPVFMDLMADRRVLEVCHSWIDPFFRFDHAWGVQHFPDEARPYEKKNIHGGPYAEQSYFQYHWRNSHPTCTCIIFSYVLEPQLPGDGGFVIVPGSHKSNLGLNGVEVFRDLLGSDFPPTTWVVQPELHAGDLLIFTEATMHGTDAWMARDRRRRNLYYKYGYGCMGWPPWDNTESTELRQRARDEQEKRLLRPPYVSTTAGNEQNWRQGTLVTEAAQQPISHVAAP